MIFIDTDNALGSPSGDVDDAYAIAALIRSGIQIDGIATVAGNTTERQAYANTEDLAAMLDYRAPVLRSDEARQLLRSYPGRIVALGPLTNVAGARAASEIILVGGYLRTAGRWPPLWPHEFNLTHDRVSALEVFRSGLPLTIFPLDVARTLYVRRGDLDLLAGPLGEYLRSGTQRWFRHLRMVRFSGKFGIYDLAAAMYLIDPEGFTIIETEAEMRPNTFLEFRRGTRPVRVCTALDRDRLWQRFLQLANG